MGRFSGRSLERLSECHPDLIRLFNEVVKGYDCTILCGHRNKADQDLAQREGKSKLAWPFSKHNRNPSLAVDVAPFPIDWNEPERFYHFAGYVMATAERLGVRVRWGGDFDQDLKFKNDGFFDAPHWELLDAPELKVVK